MPCNCGNPECITCLIEKTQVKTGPRLPDELLDAVILVVRRPAAANGQTQTQMEEAHNALMTLTNIFQLLGLTATVSTRKKAKN